MEKVFWFFTITLFSVLLTTGNGFGQCVSLTSTSTTYRQNFDTLSNAAGSIANNLTITGWYMTEMGGGARDNEQYAVDTGSSSTGDTYSYGAAGSTDRALGGQRSGALIPLFGACFTNDTGLAVNSLAISYTGEQWRLSSAGRTDLINFEYSENAASLSTGTWTGVSPLNFVTPNIVTTGAKDGNAAANRTALNSTISGLNIANGAIFWIRWTDTDASGADDGLAVDDFILTPERLAVPSLSVGDVTQMETDAASTTFAFTVSLSSPAGAGGVTFDIATANDTATTAGNDYVAASLPGQTIPAGNSTYAFNVTVNGDTLFEPDETFLVNVANVAGANVADNQGFGTIQNDDAPPALQFEFAAQLEDESQIAYISVTRTGDASVTSTAIFRPTGGTATGGAVCASGVDFVNDPQIITFSPGETDRLLSFRLCGDLTSEAAEIVNLTLSDPSPGTVLGSPNEAALTINDTASQFVNTDPIVIGFPTGSPYPSTITVDGGPSSIGGVRVTLYDFRHSNSENLDLLLVGPGGQNFLLMADAGGAGGLAGASTLTFSDSAGVILPDSSAILTGEYEPTTWEAGQDDFPAPAPIGPYPEPGSTIGGAVTLRAVFSGTNANGSWSLHIRDGGGAFREFGGSGFISGGWGLQFLAPSAGNASLSGRVSGAGRKYLPNVLVTLSGGGLSEPLTTRTNNFGNYSFENISVGQTYIVSVASNRYAFEQSSVVVKLDDQATGINFEAR